MTDTRIKEGMTFAEVILAVTEGLRGSKVAISKIGAAAKTLDPSLSAENQSYPSISTLNTIDRLGLHGNKATLFLDVLCKGDAEKAATVLRAFELGLVLKVAVAANIAMAGFDGDCTFDADRFCRKVQNSVPGYPKIVPDSVDNNDKQSARPKDFPLG